MRNRKIDLFYKNPYFCYVHKKHCIMKKQADYIKNIEIKGLWGRKNISWALRPDVNILSGVNGIGKSTILNDSVRTLDKLVGGTLTNGIKPGSRRRYLCKIQRDTQLRPSAHQLYFA